MTDLSPETVGKLVALARHAAVSASGFSQQLARAIVAELPEPVNPIEEAIVDELMVKDCTTRQAIQEAIKRGRALERGEAR